MAVVTLVTTAAPPSLRGELTRWFLEVAPGVYVGQVSQRVREQLWLLIQDHIGPGRAILSYSNNSEQGFGFEVIGHDRLPIEREGLTLIWQPSLVKQSGASPGDPSDSQSWGVGSRRRSYRGNYGRR
ncbi:type I-E CRISPR-associated endoribonuclease Cas2 [Bowdeniella nasicola]|uniref:Type I-E CRISPR-associated endoribonuclease Cas2 n=1 Tax=Bowdeniella nasicola TaxID=208480 RepID=A0A1Q5Q007_9ACTO|nr:type I-E CRISPR-associated endoribonuclease Cas2 [Bowdeniella nasicola]